MYSRTAMYVKAYQTEGANKKEEKERRERKKKKKEEKRVGGGEGGHSVTSTQCLPNLLVSIMLPSPSQSQLH